MPERLSGTTGMAPSGSPSHDSCVCTSRARARGFRLAACYGALLALSACAIRPPHFTGEVRDHETEGKPEWADRGMWTEGGRLFVTGLANGAATRADARRAAEDDARNRLAGSLRTRIESRTTDVSTLRARIDSSDEVTGTTTLASDHEVRAHVDEVVRGARLADERVESHEVFRDGWERLWSAWVLLEMSEAEYERQYRAALAR